MSKPDPHIFARHVISDLANIYAETYRTRLLLEMVARRLKIPNIEKKLRQQQRLADQMATELSAESLKAAGLTP